ncbi:MAG: protease modulator HflK [Salinisphaera sp.]|jgi:membrane protease subunit HflK|nr:protease modulator HflK [Salinisphaera sp.]
MAWNEPGKDKDPWGGGNRPKGNNNGSGPPDLDQIWRRFRARFSKGGGNGGSSNRDGSGAPGGGVPPALILVLIPIALVIWLATGLYVVQPGEKGVLLRFGAYTHTVTSGWHWHLPYPIERVYKVNTNEVRRASKRAVMLTKNENFVDIEVSAQYRISNAMNYLFSVQDPDDTVQQVLRSAVRDVVGTSTMNQVIQEGVKVEDLQEEGLDHVDLKQNDQAPTKEDTFAGINRKLVGKIKQRQNSAPAISKRSRAQLPANVRKIMQAELSNYQTGIKVLAVNVQYAQPPEQVQGAFEEAIKAREEKEQKKNLARAYARKILANVQGQKAQVLAKARGYKQQKIERAQGDASRFLQLLAQYKNAPVVTRERLYLQTMSDVLSQSRIVLNDGGSSSMMYLPLQQLLNGRDQSKKTQSAGDNGGDGSSDDTPMVPLAPSQSDGSSPGSTSTQSGSRSRSRNS